MAEGLGADAPHLPRPAPIDAYGNGGFLFGGMSHRGSILCLPDGIWAWPVTALAGLNEDVLAPALGRDGSLDIFLIGGGPDPFVLPDRLHQLFRAAGISVDCLATGPAAQTYNILLEEGRRVGAGLIAVP
jgi:uncharacterized protein